MAKTYRVGVIGRTGKGNYGHSLDTVWLGIPETEIVGVADDNKPGLTAAAKRLKTEAAFADYRKMIDETKPDIVAICPRWIDQHHEMAVYAASRGIHIYIEKPLCRTLQEADEIVRACEMTHAKLAIAHPTRTSPLMAQVKKLIQSGKIGRVLEYRGRGKEDTRGGGLDLWVLGSHVLDMIHELAGEAQWCFATVTQNGNPITGKDVIAGAEGIGPLAGEGLQAMYRMKDGTTATFGSQKNARGNPSRFGLQIYGSQGIIEILSGHMPSVKFLADSSWSPGRTGKQWQNVSSVGIDQPEPLQGGRYVVQQALGVYDLLDAIENDRHPKCNVYAARSVTEMIVGVFESHRLGQPVNFPLDNRKNPLELLKAKSS